MNLSIVLDRLTHYNPGDLVLGRVVLLSTEINSLSKPQGLKIHFRGKTSVRFTSIDFGVKGRWRTHSAEEVYFNSSKYLVGNGTSEVPELSNAGLKEYPFSYRLPENIPSTYRGTHGSVEYSIMITLKRSWGSNKLVTQHFQVNSNLDISEVRSQNELQILKKSSKFGWLWWGGTLFVNFKLLKKSYVPGESLRFSAQIINDSNSKIHRAKLILTQECKYSAQGSSHMVTHIIKKIKGPGVDSGQSTVNWDNCDALKIPSLPPSNLGFTNELISINYFVILIVQPSSLSIKDSTLTCKLPLQIGTKRTGNNRHSFHATGTNSLSGSLNFQNGGNRVANIFGCSNNNTPRGTLERNYYQNVVFPLNRCFSAPIYQNCRFSQPVGINESFEEEICDEDGDGEEQRYEPPPTYEEALIAMRDQLNQSRISSSRASVLRSPIGNQEIYQNEFLQSSPLHFNQPIYNNS